MWDAADVTLGHGLYSVCDSATAQLSSEKVQWNFLSSCEWDIMLFLVNIWLVVDPIFVV